jgi:hypothetical protein
LQESTKFRAALLEILSNLEGDWIAMNDAMTMARNLAMSRNGMSELQYSTLKSARQALKYEGLIEVRQAPDKHWEMRATEQGVVQGEILNEELNSRRNRSDNLTLPRAPFRVGKGHFLQGLHWKAILNQVKAGKLDLIVIPHDRPVKGARYWDE